MTWHASHFNAYNSKATISPKFHCSIFVIYVLPPKTLEQKKYLMVAKTTSIKQMKTFLTITYFPSQGHYYYYY